jgi:bacterial/archaeal transporter family protein
MAEWLAPAMGFLFIQGVLGVMIKLALRDISWAELLLWTSAAYAGLAACLLLLGSESFSFEAGAPWAAATGICAAGGLVLLFVSLDRGEASQVIPVTAAYPIVSAGLAAIFLAEEINWVRACGIALAVSGVAILSRN